MNWLNKLFKTKYPFPEMEERNKQLETMMDVVDEYEGVLEKLSVGVKHILGDNWYESDEIETTPMKQALMSDLLIIVLHNSLRPTITKEEEE